MAKLVLKQGGTLLGEFELRRRLTVGRQSDNDILVSDPSVSGHHAVIEACAWLAEHYGAVGKRATLDLEDMLAPGMRPRPVSSLGRKVREFLASRPVPETARY
jgi:hypothetical protein